MPRYALKERRTVCWIMCVWNPYDVINSQFAVVVETQIVQGFSSLARYAHERYRKFGYKPFLNYNSLDMFVTKTNVLKLNFWLVIQINY